MTPKTMAKLSHRKTQPMGEFSGAAFSDSCWAKRGAAVRKRVKAKISAVKTTARVALKKAESCEALPRMSSNFINGGAPAGRRRGREWRWQFRWPAPGPEPALRGGQFRLPWRCVLWQR